MPVGILPVALPAYLIGGGASVQAAWAWYDPTVFENLLASSDIERKIAGLNNAFHLLWRTTATMPAPADDYAAKKIDAAVAQLDSDMAGWWTWKQEYNRAGLTSWIPFTGDWEDELNRWLVKFQEDNEKLALAYAASESSRKEWERMLRARGLDVRDHEPDVSVSDMTADLIKGAGQTAIDVQRASWFWPSVSVVVVIGGLLWLGSQTKANA